MYTVENQTDESVKTVHHNLLLPLPVLHLMGPFNLDTLVKPVCVDNDANEIELDDAEDSDVDSDGDIESPSNNEINYVNNRSNAIIEEPVGQKIKRQSDFDSYKSADSGSNIEDGTKSP